jgi:hypothetical protein
VVAAEFAVFAGEPGGTALAEDDVAWDDEFACEVLMLAFGSPVAIAMDVCTSSFLRA